MPPSSRTPEEKPNRGGDEERFIQLVAEMLGVDEERVRADPSFFREAQLDSLDRVELLMELDDEFKWP